MHVNHPMIPLLSILLKVKVLTISCGQCVYYPKCDFENMLYAKVFLHLLFTGGSK